MKLLPLPAFDDNYIWLLHNTRQAVVVDPGVAAPVLQALQRYGLALRAILVTHHHGDHVGGVAEIRNATGAQVYGPAGESIPQPYIPVSGGDRLHALETTWEVLDVPGHTAGHIAYAGQPPGLPQPLLFCGDTLFSGGCGRLFEGTAAQMHESLSLLAALPGNTQVCCAHEYTLSNLRFARAVEPHNEKLIHYSQWCEEQRSQGHPTLPSSIALEQSVNPFLRVSEPAVQAAARGFRPDLDTNDAVAVLAALRQWKNEFR